MIFEGEGLGMRPLTAPGEPNVLLQAGNQMELWAAVTS
jgi:hypothetical protein